MLLSSRRPFLAYLLGVVLPSALIAAAGALLARQGWHELAASSQLQVGRMALGALEADLAGGLLPSAATLGRVLGHRIALIRNGVTVASTDPPPPPEGAGGSMLVRPEGGATPGGSFTVLVGPGTPAVPQLPAHLFLVTALLLVFASLAGWIQLGGVSGGQRTRSVLLLSALPALTAWGFLAQTDVLYREAARKAERRDLARALAVARLQGVAAEPAAVQRLTGFNAWRVRGGVIAEASVPGPAVAVAALRAPPPNFASTGMVETPAGAAAYAALRLPGDQGFTVVAAPRRDRPGRFTRNAVWAGAALAAWFVLAGALAARQGWISSGQ